MRTADVVLIGGGIVGSSIAYHLVAAGCKNVLAMERETAQGKGSTGKSMGGVRAQFSTPVNIQMSLYSIPFFRDFEDALGHPSGYRAQGYLFVAASSTHLNYLRANLTRQVALGLTTARLLDPEDIVKMVPQLRSDDIVGGSFCSTDGFVDPCVPTLSAKPPFGPDWVHEIKHDGYRLIVRRDGKAVRLSTRRGHDWTERYPAIAGAAAKLRARSFTLDGEAVVCSADGVAVFGQEFGGQQIEGQQWK